MAAKELTIAVLLTIVIGSNGGSYSNQNHKYNSNYAPIPQFVFKPIAESWNPPKPPVTADDLLTLFNRALEDTTAWTRAATSVNSGGAAVRGAFGSYPAKAQAALQALADASPEIAQQFISSGTQFSRLWEDVQQGMVTMVPGVFYLINVIVFTGDLNDPAAIQQLTNLFDVLRHLANVLWNFILKVSPGTLSTLKNYIAQYHVTIASLWNGMIGMATNVVNRGISMPETNIVRLVEFIYSRIMRFEVKSCSSHECVGLSQFLANIKTLALNVLRLYRP